MVCFGTSRCVNKSSYFWTFQSLLVFLSSTTTSSYQKILVEHYAEIILWNVLLSIGSQLHSNKTVTYLLYPLTKFYSFSYQLSGKLAGIYGNCLQIGLTAFHLISLMLNTLMSQLKYVTNLFALSTHRA